ncbi:conserved hypothetical protein [uncultured Paludibacter sp.]|nr:conserved hypothetical protein [uncultured Paludibacter sp.]
MALKYVFTKMIFKGKFPKKYAKELFTDSDKVLQFISEIKWQEGFVCRKCGNTNYCEGKTPYSRRCTRCKKEESASAHTLFHNIKFPINKAFYIAYNVCILHKDFSSYNYAEQLDINQMTCWKFKRRILKCVENNSSNRKDKIESILLTNTFE